MLPRILLFALFLIFSPAAVLCIDVTLAPRHYLDAMEFYYKAPRPEIIKPMLRSLAQAGILANAEKRMLVAAFLSELIRAGTIKPAELVAEARSLDRSARLTLAWSLHLGMAGDTALEELLPPTDAAFTSQIRNSPRNLKDWNPAWERSVLGMYWGAFMATGNPVWLDGIITAALNAAGGGAPNLPAASLYESFSRHPLVAERLRARLNGVDNAGKRMIETILAHK